MWRLRWRVVTARRRLLAWNLVVPVLILLPVALSAATAPHRAAVVGVLVVSFGAFGFCIPLVRDRAAGWTEKVALTGYGVRPWLAERVVSETTVDLVELSPALLVVVLVTGGGGPTADPAALLRALPALFLALLAAALVGALVAAFVSSIAEAALACGAAALFALHFAGLFRAATPGTWAAWMEAVSPFRPLVLSLRDVLRAGAPGGAAETGLAGPGWIAPLLATGALASILLAAAPRLARRTGRAG